MESCVEIALPQLLPSGSSGQDIPKSKDTDMAATLQCFATETWTEEIADFILFF